MTDDNDTTFHQQGNQHRTTIVEGAVEDLITKEVDDSKEKVDPDHAVVFSDLEVVRGSLWMSDQIPDAYDTAREFTNDLQLHFKDYDYVGGAERTDEREEAAEERLSEVYDDLDDVSYDDVYYGSDFKVADKEDQDTEVSYDADGNAKGVDVGGGTWPSSEAEEFDHDTQMIWYGGMAAQWIARPLDFNGLPWARYSGNGDGDSPYLLKGLFQVPHGWRGEDDAETTDRGELARSESRGGLGRPPRTARPALLREDLEGERIFIALGRYKGGQMPEVHVGRALDDYDEFEEQLLSDDDVDDDLYDRIEPTMVDDSEAVQRLASAYDDPEDVFGLFEGEGWVGEPEDAVFADEGADTSGASFDTGASVATDEVEHPTQDERQFANSIVEDLQGTDIDPTDAVFDVEGEDEKVDLSVVVEMNSDEFSVSPDAEAITEVVFENSEHLDASDL